MYRPCSRNHSLVLMLVLAFPCLVAGCSPRPHLSADFGEAYFTGTRAQVLNPSAPEYPNPVQTLPGELAVQIYQQRYIKSMTEEKKEKEDVSSELSN